MKKFAPWLFTVYFLLCISPYFISSLNSITPKLFHIPFTVWSVLLLVVMGCFLMYYLSKNVWESYDDPEEVQQSGEEK